MLIQSSRRSAQKADSVKAPPVQATEPPRAPESTSDDTPIAGPLSGDAGQRIGHFVRQVTSESLQQVRYLSVANAFQKVGSTVGSLALTPLAIKMASDNAPLIGGMAIGGTVAAGAIGAVLGYAWLHHKDGKAENKAISSSKLVDNTLDVATALQSMPKFMYPTVMGATDAQREVIYNALDQLPLHQATASQTMQVVPDLLDTGISGMSQPGASHIHILLDESRLNSARNGTELVLHEQAHAVDYSGGFGLVGAHNWKGGFGRAPFVSGYAESNRYEDFAESFEAYSLDPEGFRSEFPAKAAHLDRIAQTDVVTESLDTPRVRSAGRQTATEIGKVPYLRTGLELAGSLVAPVQVYRGSTKLLDGLESGDMEKQLDGKFALAGGLFLTVPGAAPLSLASSIAGAAIRNTAQENPESLDTANKWADRTLALSAGPVGMAASALTSELKLAGMRLDSSQGFTPEGWREARPGKGNMLKGTLATVGGTVVGAIAGASLGAAVGGNSGAVLGALWGNVAGGAVGLAGYGIHRALSQSDPQDPLALTREDRKFLATTVGGTVLGGAAGAVGGGVGGRMLGTAIGQALGGSGAAALGGSLGAWAGGLAGAYSGAKLGAGLGSGRLLGGNDKLNDTKEAWKL